MAAVASSTIAAAASSTIVSPNFGVLFLQIKGQFGMFYFSDCNPVFLCCSSPNETLLSYVLIL